MKKWIAPLLTLIAVACSREIASNDSKISVPGTTTNVTVDGDPQTPPPSPGIPGSPVLISNIPFVDPAFRQCVLDYLNLYLPPIITSDQVTFLASCSTDVSSIGGIEYFTNLSAFDVSLSVSGHLDLAPLASLPKLQAMDMQGLGFGNESLKIARILPALIALGLNGTKVDDLSNLQGSTFSYLSLAGNSLLHDITNLASIPNITAFSSNAADLIAELPYSGSNITELHANTSDYWALNGIAKMTQLKFLDVYGSSDFSFLSNLTNLETLYIAGTGELTPLSNLVNLKNLNISYMYITSLLPLKPLTKIEQFICQGCWLGGLEGLENSKNLKMLSARDGYVQSIEPLRDHTQLTYLDLDENRLTDIDAAATLTSLEFVSLGSNRLTDVRSLLNLDHIIDIRLFGNDQIPCSQLAVLRAKYGEESFPIWMACVNTSATVPGDDNPADPIFAPM